MSVLRLALTAMDKVPLDKQDGLLHALIHIFLRSQVRFVQKFAPTCSHCQESRTQFRVACTTC